VVAASQIRVRRVAKWAKRSRSAAFVGQRRLGFTLGPLSRRHGFGPLRALALGLDPCLGLRLFAP